MGKKFFLIAGFVFIFTGTLFPEAFPIPAGAAAPGTYTGWTDPALFLAPFGSDARLPLLHPAGAAGCNLSQYTLALGSMFPQTPSSGLGATLSLAGAALVPLPFAVLWGGFEGIISPKALSEMKDQDGFSLAAGFSKKLGETFSFGLGITSTWPQDTAQNWSMGLSLGFQQDFPFLGQGGSSLYGSLINGGNGPEKLYPYTILSGWKSTLIDHPVELAAGLQLASPAFTDLWIQPSFAVTLGKSLALSIGWNSSLLNGEQNSWYPTISLTVNSGSWLRLGEMAVMPRFRVQPVWSRGIGVETAVTMGRGEKDRQGPAIEVAPPLQEVYVDGTDDSITDTRGPIVVDALPRKLKIALSSTAMSTDPASPASKITATFSEYDETGLLAWTIRVVNSRGETYRTWKGNRANLDQFSPSLQFNGLTDEKDYIPDGTYRFTVEMEYANGDTLFQTSPFFTVISQKPQGHVRPSRNSLSVANPEGILFYHDLSSDAEWHGYITDANQRVIKTFPLGRSTEPAVRWQGDTDSGTFAEPGTYFYTAEGVNAVGLTGRTAPISISVEPLQKGTVLLLASPDLFSGQAGEGKVTITPRYQEIGTIQGYNFAIRNRASGTVVKQETGTLPGSFVWDGRDSLGIPCPDGTYQAVLSLNLANGSTVTAASQPITLDSTPPRATVSVRASLFSPNGDGNRDTITFDLTAEGGLQWTASIIDSEGRIIKSFSWKERAPANLIWDGLDGENAPVPDGQYRLVLEGFDLAGNRVTVTSNLVTLDARKPSATITSDLIAFSPNGDGFADRVNIRLVTTFTDGLSRFRVEIRDGNGKTVCHLAEGSSLEPSARFQWNGSADATGSIVSDGEYTIWAQLEYSKGDVVRVSGKPILLDRSPPEISISLEPQPFSPDHDGTNDVLSIILSAKDASEINGWKLSILDPAGRLFTSFSGQTIPPEPILWDGYNLDNELIEAAQEYLYIIQVRDALGNMATKKGSLFTN